MDLDLNQEILDPIHTSAVEFESTLESDHGHIHDRIRHLEAVTSRARQRLRWPPIHPPIQVTNFTGGEAATADAQDEGREKQEAEEGIVGSEKGNNKKGVHLIAKALGVETDAGKGKGRTGSLFDCNICFDIARDPVLTCCGHLFCWPCFYQLSYAYYTVKECPVCKRDVSETGIIPIYGNSNASNNCQLELKQAGLMFPPRPRAPRVDSMRQRLISQRASSSVVQNLQRFRNLMGGLGEPVQPESPNTASDRNAEYGSDEISRLIEGAASYSSFASAVNSAMGSAETLVRDLEPHHHGYNTRGNRRLNRRAANGSSTSSGNVAAGFASPLNWNVGTAAVIGSEIQTTDSNVQISPQDSTSSGRRRRNVSRQVSNETRRRRLT